MRSYWQAMNPGMPLPAELLPVPQPAVSQPAATRAVAMIEQGELPLGFTGTSNEMDAIAAAGYPVDSSVYMTARDLAYIEAASQATSNQVIAWSSAGGYHPIEIGSPEYWETQSFE